MIAPCDVDVGIVSGTVVIETGISDMLVVTVVVLAGSITNELVVSPVSLALVESGNTIV